MISNSSVNEKELNDLIKKAGQIYKENFPMETCFERAVFFSWGCTIGNCTFCYMSTQPKEKNITEARRSFESIFAEFILAKNLGWEIGFFSGGIGVFKPAEIELMLKTIYEITGEKVWLNIGPISKLFLKNYAPYIKGVVSSIETIDPELHKKVCPSKPIEPYERMYNAAREIGLKTGMTFILGLGEKKEDFPLLIDFIKKHCIEKLNLYSLIPHNGTVFEGDPAISKEYHAWWIAKLRIEFPKLDIQCGIWEDRVDRIAFLLCAGANSLSKFKATKLFGTKIAEEIEQQSESAGRKFKGTLTKIPDIDWDGKVDRLSLDEEMREKIRKKLNEYLDHMRKGVSKIRIVKNDAIEVMV